MKNEVRNSFIPAGAVHINENFADRKICFDNPNDCTWGDYRPQYSTAIQEVQTMINFGRELQGRTVTFTYNQQQRGGGSAPMTPSGGPVRKRVKVTETCIVLTAQEIELFLEFSSVLNRIRTEFKDRLASPAGGSNNAGLRTPTTSSSSSAFHH